MTGEWSLQAGWSVQFDQLDDDPELELVIGETRNVDGTGGDQPDERVDVVEAEVQSGPLVDQSWRLAESEVGATVNEGLQAEAWFGYSVVRDEPDGHLLISAPLNTDDYDVAAFEYPADHTLGPYETVGTITESSVSTFALLPTEMGIWSLPRGRFLWTGSYGVGFAGEVHLFDLPLLGAHTELDARAVYRADPGDYVQLGIVNDADLDGDGVSDLVMGAKDRDAVGEIAVLSDPPDGDLRIWDIAEATYRGEEYIGRFGDQVATGDLDGDGQADLLTGAAMVYGSCAFHAFRGPTAGAHLASDSDWTIHGADGFERLGVSSAAADLDGDGAEDLIVGRPGNPALGTLDGSVLVYRGPLAPGTYAPEDAAFEVRNSQRPGTGDFFGIFLRTGDLTGDGAAELAISAPDDVEDGHPSGSVHILFGRADLFDP
ncbi:MAG: FG-GAP repeat protein [Myxococcota bacterium]